MFKDINLPEPIFEIGSLQVLRQEGYADSRPFFKGKSYIGCDMCLGARTILMVETLEHVENPHKALDEIYRVLKKEGISIITSQMNFPIHDYPRASGDLLLKLSIYY